MILGPHHADAFADAINGTITGKVLGAVACPVLIARQEVHGDYRKVLVALDGSPRSAQVLREVEALGLTDAARSRSCNCGPPRPSCAQSSC